MRLGIATKIFIAFAAVILLFTAVLMFSFYRTQKTADHLRIINQTYVPLSLVLSDLQNDLKTYNSILNERDELVLRRTLQVTRLAPALPGRFRARIARATLLADVGKPNSEENWTNRRSVQQRIRSLSDDFQTYTDQSSRFTSSVLDDNLEPADVQKHQSDLQVRGLELDRKLTRLRNDVSALTDAGTARANESERTTLYGLIGVSTAAMVASLLLLFWILWTMRPLGQLTHAAKRIGEGDYQPVESLSSGRRSTDELGVLVREFNDMTVRLSERDQALRTQHAKLIRSERLATIGQMTSVITHEIRNPLSSINLNTEMLVASLQTLDSNLDLTEIVESLNDITSEVDRLKEITEEYLAHVRLPKPRIQSENLVAIIEGLVDFHQGEWSRSDVGVSVFGDEQALHVPMDANQIRQALLNLIRNAIEASPSGSSIEIAAHRRDEGVVITVRDQGRGIAPDQLDKVFDPFFTTKPSGTGLGLAMTQQIVEDHRGFVRVESGSAGTTFEVFLPLSEQEQDT